GQPLHAFDYRLLQGRGGQGSTPVIVVRRAAEGEKFTSLDGQERILTSQMLLIADETKAVALAGVMGGHNSEIGLNTQDVLLESAYFKPQNIRATSKRLELRTESSYRFERGGDEGICDWASQRATQLILETAGGAVAGGVVDAYPEPAEPRQITLRHQKVKDLLGIDLSSEQIEYYLGQLGLKAATRKPRPVDAPPGPTEPATFRVPTYRVDLKREVDLIEEVARLYGVDRIPATPPRGALGSNAYDSEHDQLAEARRLLAGLGLNESQGQTLISESAARLVVSAPLVPLANPLSSDMNVLRPSLLPGLLEALRHNLSHKNDNVALFEVGRVFLVPEPELAKGAQTHEERRLAIALTGARHPAFWSGEDREAKFDIFDLKGILEEFCDQFGLRGITYARRAEASTLYAESGTIQLGKFSLGEFGQLLPTVAKRYDLRDPVFLAELNLDLLLARRNTSKAFKPLPAYPAIRRDIAMVVAESTTHDAVLQAVKQAKAQHLESVELFDVFRGKNVPEHQKSMAYAFVYRSPERTLTDAEANSAHEKVVSQLKQKLQATIRES
ncbi:MAG TPA: phenylalanine--tRNA ligase subunit beta, partial [Verrucomicrobiae bacterium]|nr:phenylalanine--tRNA ligase subunit beta [Verrucomicrobiae bacterium]